MMWLNRLKTNYLASRKRLVALMEICARKLDAAGENLMSGIYEIYCKIIETCKFLDNWKVGKAITVFKKGINSNRDL